MLLVRVKATGRWFFPGGGARKSELLTSALARELQEETGLHVRINRQLGTWEHFFYHNPTRRAYHMYMTFYVCTVATGAVRDSGDDKEATDKPTWVPVRYLKRSQFDPVLWPIVRKALAESSDHIESAR